MLLTAASDSTPDTKATALAEDVDGSPCGGQSSGACVDALATVPVCDTADSLSFPPDPGAIPVKICENVVTTRGTEAAVIGDASALLAALGLLDTPEKAGLWLRHIDPQVACGSVRAVDGGFQVLVEAYRVDCGITEERLYFVARDGAVDEPRTANRHGTPCVY